MRADSLFIKPRILYNIYIYIYIYIYSSVDGRLSLLACSKSESVGEAVAAILLLLEIWLAARHGGAGGLQSSSGARLRPDRPCSTL